MHHINLSEAIPGDNVGFHVKGVVTKALHRGMVCGNTNDDPPGEVSEFKA